ncbi:hypothetical protein ACHAWF_010503 [Thalassiosira exigua]
MKGSERSLGGRKTSSSNKRMAWASTFNIAVAMSTVFALRLFILLEWGPRSLLSSVLAPSCESGGDVIIASNDDVDAPNGPAFDFAVIGFPKTGTSFLLDVLNRHPQIEMPKQEFCEIHGKDGVRKASEWLRDRSLMTTAPETSPPSAAFVKYGMKCPIIIKRADAIENLAKMSKHTRLLLSLRHPVRYFESFYNYRVEEHYKHGRDERVPTPFELSKGRKHWRDVSTAYARYEVFMQQLAKTPMNMRELQDMLNERLYQKQISPNPFKVFVFASDQLQDKDEMRRTKFQTDLQEFLGLKVPMMDLAKAPKVNSSGNHTRHPEEIDICDRRYDGIRKQLLASGKKTSLWIRNKFIKSPDLAVSSEDYFSALITKWGEDPCH